MKTLRTLLVSAVVIFGFTATSFGQDSNKATQTATASVIKPLTIKSVQVLDFGIFAGLNDLVSTVSIAANGTRSGSAQLVSTNAGAQGTFTITGEPNSAISISLPGTQKSLTDGIKAPMTIEVADWITNLGNQASLGNVSLGGTGIITLSVGTKLNVGVAQAKGDYKGDYDITVNYN